MLGKFCSTILNIFDVLNFSIKQACIPLNSHECTYIHIILRRADSRLYSSYLTSFSLLQCDQNESNITSSKKRAIVVRNQRRVHPAVRIMIADDESGCEMVVHPFIGGDHVARVVAVPFDSLLHPAAAARTLVIIPAV